MRFCSVHITHPQTIVMVNTMVRNRMNENSPTPKALRPGSLLRSSSKDCVYWTNRKITSMHRYTVPCTWVLGKAKFIIKAMFISLFDKPIVPFHHLTKG
jgi:hypothetical protein